MDLAWPEDWVLHLLGKIGKLEREEAPVEEQKYWSHPSAAENI